MRKWIINLVLTVLVVLLLISQHIPQHLVVETRLKTEEHLAPRIWVSMGLCFGQNAIILGKTNFPYNEAAVRSILLWHKLTNATVAITIVHNNKYTSDSLKKYAQELEDLGASVVVHHEDVLHCVLTSQIVRLVNVHLHDDIEPDDVVITADVDAFIMNPALLKPLDHHNVSAWVWRYGLSLSSGFTFAMSFVGARSRTWKEMVRYDGSVSGMMNHYRELITPESSWGWDQAILTFSLLQSGVCSLEEKSKLWRLFQLEPHQFNDSLQCWHGAEAEYEDCNKNRVKSGDKCLWWHFYPSETVENLRLKYQEIIKHRNITFQQSD